MSGPTVSRTQALGDTVETDPRVICAVCDKTDKLLRCSHCKAVFYCTKDHQRRDWERHKEFCTTHPARGAPADKQTFSIANRNFNRDVPSKHHSVGNRRTPKARVSNLNNISVADASWATNVTAESYRNAKHLTGTISLLSRWDMVIVKYICSILRSNNNEFRR